MSTVLILGAGGSVAQAASFRPRNTRSHPPLDGNFFEKIDSLDQLNFLRDSLRIAVTSAQWVPSAWPLRPPMEQYFADVFYYFSRGTPGSLGAYRLLLRTYNEVIAETTNWITGRNSRLGVIDRVLRHELDRSDGEFTIVTFNQDLLLEDALARLPDRFGSFGLMDIYPWATTFLAPLKASSLVPSFPFRADGNPLPVKLLKLHGSLNWIRRSKTLDPARSSLMGQGKGSLFLYDRRQVSSDLQLSDPGSAGRTLWYTWPLIVPPIYDKGLMFGGLLEKQWDHAHDRLRTADRVVLAGYSVPDADAHARQFLRASVGANPDLRWVEVVNPDPDVVSSLSATLDIDGIGYYSGFEAYLHRPT